jgi:hypothetical protein
MARIAVPWADSSKPSHPPYLGGRACMQVQRLFSVEEKPPTAEEGRPLTLRLLMRTLDFETRARLLEDCPEVKVGQSPVSAFGGDERIQCARELPGSMSPK